MQGDLDKLFAQYQEKGENFRATISFEKYLKIIGKQVHEKRSHDKKLQYKSLLSMGWMGYHLEHGSKNSKLTSLWTLWRKKMQSNLLLYIWMVWPTIGGIMISLLKDMHW